MNNYIIKLMGKSAGPTTVIMAGVHGNEKAGIIALDELLSTNFEIETGIVYVIYANIQAMEKNVRCVEKNMNRCFIENGLGNSYEEKRSQEIIGYLQQADYLLDIHNTTNQYNSVPMLISEYPDLGEYFDVEYIVSGFDTLHPGGSDGYMNSIGKKGLCIECGSIYDNNGSKLAKESIVNFLRYTGNISGTLARYTKQIYIRFTEIYKNKTNAFRFEKEFRDMEKIAKGALIGYDDTEEIRAGYDGYILFSSKPKKIGDECFVLGNNQSIGATPSQS